MHASLALAPKTSSRGGRYPYVLCLSSRKFMGHVADYTNASNAGNGVRWYYSLPPGAYLVQTPVSWKHYDKYYVVVRDTGEIERVDDKTAKNVARDQRSRSGEKKNSIYI